MAYSYKQWGTTQEDDNVIHASDLVRWQDGITDAGGSWEGSWTDNKDTLTADQLNALETEIASLYGSGFTAKTFADGNIPGVDEWNRIEDAINTILNRTAFAIYCETDNSLTFYVSDEVPNEGDTYDGKTVTNVWTGFDKVTWANTSDPYWINLVDIIESVVIDKSFSMCKPISMAYWFRAFSVATFSGLGNIDTSKVTTFRSAFNNAVELDDISGLKGWDISNATNLSYMFRGCTGITSLEPISGWDISNATNLSYMFCECSGLTDVEILANWDTSSATNIEQIFNGCSGVTAIDVSKWNVSKVTSLAYTFQNMTLIEELDLSGWDTSNVTSMIYMFNGCPALKTVYVAEGQFNIDKVTTSTGMFRDCANIVGGNGTTYNSSNQDASMAHIDTADNPGYFTKKE